MDFLTSQPSTSDARRARLAAHGQSHVLRFWDELDAPGRQKLAAQLDSIDFDQLESLYRQGVAERNWAALARRAVPASAMRLHNRQLAHGKYSATDARERAASALRGGKVGVLLVAGGQGSRLGFDQPKGLYPIGPVSGATLLQIHFEKALAAARRYGASVPVYVMTSHVTHDEQLSFLKQHNWFGTPSEDVVLFRQGRMPAVDTNTGRLMLAAKDSLFLSPDGHGGTLAALASSGALEHMHQHGIEHLFYLQVDNPLVPICDLELIGYHLLAGSDLTSVAVSKRTPQDRLGVFVTIDGRMHVIEYSDLPDDVAAERDESGSLRFWAGSIALHLFSTAFLDRALALKDALPFHTALKKVPYLDEAGQLVEPREPNALKFERFIFDLLPHARNPLVVELAEADVFAPLKNASGAERDTPEYVRECMIAQHKRWLEAAGTRVRENVPIEISPLWALDAEGVAARDDRPTEVKKATYLTNTPI